MTQVPPTPECTNVSTQNASSNDASTELDGSKFISQFSLVKLFAETFETTLRSDHFYEFLDQVRLIESTILSLQKSSKISFNSRSSETNFQFPFNFLRRKTEEFGFISEVACA